MTKSIHSKKSSALELFALAFLIHFFGALLFSVFITSSYKNYEIALQWSAGELHWVLGGISIPSVIMTMTLELLYAKPMSMTVAKYLFRLWMFGICVLVCWAWITSVS